MLKYFGEGCLLHYIAVIVMVLSFGLLHSSVNGTETTEYYSPENIFKFAEYLYQEGDYLRAAGEYQRYLFYLPEDADSALYKIGLCYRREGNFSKAISFFQKLRLEYPESHLRSAASYQIAYSYFTSGQYDKSVKFIDGILNETGSEVGSFGGRLQMLRALNLLHQKRWQDAEKILQNLRDENLNDNILALKAGAQEGRNLPCKNPALAGLLSAVLPGAGKMYCKQYGDGFYSLALIVTTGLAAWDGFQDNGIYSASGWFFGSLCGIFYAGNVYGSSIAARIYNRQLETDLLRRLPRMPEDQ